MARSKPSAVKRYHDRVASRYDQSYDDAFWQWHDALTWDYLKPHLPRDLSAEIIDLGCGTGKWTAKLAKTGFAVTGVDISHRMLDQARRKVEEHAGARPASFVQADLCDLSILPQGRFALAVALGDPIGCTSSPARAMKEIRGVLRDRGILVATFDHRWSAIEFYLQKGDARKLSRFLRDGLTHWLTRDAEEQFPIHTFTPHGVIRLAEAAGFEVMEIIGKTVLPMRHYRHLLDTSESRRAWAAIEKKLSRDRDALARASHLQITCRRLP